MTLRDIIINLKRIFQKKIKNQIQLGNDSNLESNLKFLKVSDKSTPIQISEDTVNIQGSLNVNGSAVQTGTDAGATELDGLSDVTYSSGDLTITSLDTIVAGGDLTFDVDGTIILDPSDKKVNMQAQHRLYFDGGTETYIDEETTDRLRFSVGGDEMLILDEASDAITLSATNWIAGTVSGETITEFSAANSSYAGMILGYTSIGANAADDSQALTTLLSHVTDSGGERINVSFKTPPSELVEIEVSLFFSCGSSASDLILSISDNGTYGSNTLDSPLQHEKRVCEPARGNGGTVVQKWLLKAASLAAIGSSNAIYIAVACDSTAGTPIIKWGGDATDEYTNLYMKATALPATIVEGS